MVLGAKSTSLSLSLSILALHQRIAWREKIIDLAGAHLLFSAFNFKSSNLTLNKKPQSASSLSVSPGNSSVEELVLNKQLVCGFLHFRALSSQGHLSFHWPRLIRSLFRFSRSTSDKVTKLNDPLRVTDGELTNRTEEHFLLAGNSNVAQEQTYTHFKVNWHQQTYKL